MDRVTCLLALGMARSEPAPSALGRAGLHGLLLIGLGIALIACGPEEFPAPQPPPPLEVDARLEDGRLVVEVETAPHATVTARVDVQIAYPGSSSRSEADDSGRWRAELELGSDMQSIPLYVDSWSPPSPDLADPGHTVHEATLTRTAELGPLVAAGAWGCTFGPPCAIGRTEDGGLQVRGALGTRFVLGGHDVTLAAEHRRAGVMEDSELRVVELPLDPAAVFGGDYDLAPLSRRPAEPASIAVRVTQADGTELTGSYALPADDAMGMIATLFENVREGGVRFDPEGEGDALFANGFDQEVSRLGDIRYVRLAEARGRERDCGVFRDSNDTRRSRVRTYADDLHITYVERRTGRVLASRLFRAELPACPRTYERELHAEPDQEEMAAFRDATLQAARTAR